MFSEQDAVWLPNKIEVSYSEMKKLEDKNKKDVSLLVFTDFLVTEQDLNIISNSLWNF
jgi:hypothetical protein